MRGYRLLRPRRARAEFASPLMRERARVREGGKEGEKERGGGERERARERGREGERERGREGEMERGREGERRRVRHALCSHRDSHKSLSRAILSGIDTFKGFFWPAYPRRAHVSTSLLSVRRFCRALWSLGIPGHRPNQSRGRRRPTCPGETRRLLVERGR